MQVTVVIPAYRAVTTICRAIDSVLAQTSRVSEIIVVDDGSPDETAAVIEQTYGDHVILIRQANGGVARARNAAIDRATGDFVAFLDADDYWEPQKLERQLAVFEQHPELGLVAGQFFEEMPGENRQESRLRQANDLPWDAVVRVCGLEAFRLATSVWTGTVIMRRSALGSEWFALGLEPAEDRDLWTRTIVVWPVYLMSEPLATCVLERGSLSRGNVDRDCSNMLRVVERNRNLLGFFGSKLWRSHTLYRWAALDPEPSSALPRLLKAFALWPLPYYPFAPCRILGRVKRLVVLLRQLLLSVAVQR
jgi:glycosyltransferase involved in cell wall biosynthesis